MAKENKEKAQDVTKNISVPSVFDTINTNDTTNQKLLVQEENQSTTVTKIKPIKEKKIQEKLDPTFVYYFYLADSDIEYWSFDNPEIFDGVLYLKNVIKQETIKEIVAKQEIYIVYNKDINNKKSNFKFPLIDCEGIAIKCYNINNVDLSWIYKSEEKAKEELKEKKLLLYENLMPHLLQKLEETNNRSNTDNLMDF